MRWPRFARRATGALREPEDGEDRAPGRAGTTLAIADAAIIELTESGGGGLEGLGSEGSPSLRLGVGRERVCDSRVAPVTSWTT